MTTPAPDAPEQRDNAAFAALMWAMARPGDIHALPGGMADLMRALIDRECRVMSDDPRLALMATEAGATLVAAPFADHAFLGSAGAVLATLAALPVGSALYPDAGATLVLAARLGEGCRLALSGPGIETKAELRVGGLPDGFWALRAARCAYPEGVEIVLVDGARVAALPRSTRVEEI